ncbi:U2 small nuclear ribonucleoprotein A', putative [Perkinsus marinus ATCC 50983]|uniref:U2 small nuclear ribonucleoprotein A', putative n=1 Tax=Perkinsus marinus (strain ATCC 50983 / TXsc) TaxID=423536 RepID=C5LCG4_PERM5|nr:U2 small nuclear ribonucleoprotein A', putative [Perkinsus marinus ATCC 50983]EER05647.1 U2 small nuclear ribonucleoprotein A', putative [Perkinsus marinus ATCC 50983]|eukprot:XP_002773831.1 U2 small nuclear ribonucleoprotein A', putative [Perkinsus marinus ATCC 50983]
MPALTEELIRKRAEHNEGILADLEEIALHQEEIEKIEKCLGERCRRIKILLLQNNVIGKLENLNKLKELEYLNVAVNNIEKIEGLERCESLRKLDLTVNFIDIENLKGSITNLEGNYNLEDLYLLGNPCMDWSKARQYVVARLPSLLQLDGTLVTPTERIQARRELPKLEEELERLSDFSIKRKNYEREHGITPSEGGGISSVVIFGYPKANLHIYAYTKESRLEMYREQGAAKEEKKRRERKRLGLEAKPPRKVPEVMNQRGEIRQCNEGKYNFHIDEFGTPGMVVMEIDIPAFMDTSFIDVDIQPNYVRCVIKEKLTQLRTPCEVVVHASTVKRSSTTGALRIEMPRADQSGMLRVKEKEEKPKQLLVVIYMEPLLGQR